MGTQTLNDYKALAEDLQKNCQFGDWASQLVAGVRNETVNPPLLPAVIDALRPRLSGTDLTAHVGARGGR